MLNNYLSFSDSAKFADIARNLISGFGYGNNFSFWSSNIFELIKSKIFPAPSVPFVTPFSIALSFKIFGINDFAVIATSFFYFILTLIFVFLLSKKIFNSKLVGTLSTLAVAFNKDMIDYALQGGSESPFIFEIVLSCFLVSLKKKWANVALFFVLVAMYFTRPQAFIYISGVVLFWLLTNLNYKKAILGFIGIVVLSLVFDYFVLMPLSGRYFLYSVIGRGIGSSFSQISSASDSLRGAAEVVSSGRFQIVKNIFYNLYNFFKLMPQIMSPYLFGLFSIGLFVWKKDKLLNSFKSSAVFMIVVTFLVTAASIPFFRYLHPVVPVVYILAVGTMVQILTNLIDKKFIVIVSLALISVFGVGQTLGVLFLDSRFEKKIHNTEKHPVYVELSKTLKNNTDPDDVVITNLDTWGSWYGERKTVWFPMEPKQLIDPSTGKIPFDAIYLTSYKIDDANYYMGESWRQIFDYPKDSKKWKCEGCDEISREFKLKSEYLLDTDSNYEKEYFKAVLLIRK